jgi:hypothetical protein
MIVRTVKNFGTLFAFALAFSACGGSPTQPTNSTTTGTSSPQNRAPSVSASGSASFGIAQQTTFTFNASASDPDGDPVTIAWNFGDGTSGSGTTVTKSYTSGGVMTVTATASDGKGASTASTVSVTIGSLSGEWSGTVDLNTCLPGVVKPVTASFTQSGGLVTGSVVLSQGLCRFNPGTAVTDPAEPGTFSAAGAVRVRVKIQPYTDVYFQGQMDSTGRVITGGLQGSGHAGTPFILTKQ